MSIYGHDGMLCHELSHLYLGVSAAFATGVAVDIATYSHSTIYFFRGLEFQCMTLCQMTSIPKILLSVRNSVRNDLTKEASVRCTV